jgi:hypothetical protein
MLRWSLMIPVTRFTGIINLTRQLRCRTVEFPQLFGKMPAGMNRGARHGMPHTSSSTNYR